MLVPLVAVPGLMVNIPYIVIVIQGKKNKGSLRLFKKVSGGPYATEWVTALETNQDFEASVLSL